MHGYKSWTWMRIVSAQWTPRVNYLFIECSCGASIPHRADRWRVVCKACGADGNLADIRLKYLQETYKK
jgi:hypothetical protein